MDKFRCKSAIILLFKNTFWLFLTHKYILAIFNINVFCSDIYSQISDSNGHMIHKRFNDYLKEVLALTAAVYESPSFGYNEGLASSIFPLVSRTHTSLLYNNCKKKLLTSLIIIIFSFTECQGNSQ